MLIATVSIIIIICNLFIKKSKTLYIITFLWMWVLMAGTYGAADEGIYISRYTFPESWQSVTEYLYSLILLFFNKLGISFISFKIIITFVQLTLISSTIWKYSLYPNIVLALYFLFPFPMHIVQMRSALATAIFIWGLRYIIESNDKEILVWHMKFYVSDIKYVSVILVASLVHTQSIGWLLLLVAKRSSIRFTVLFTIIFNLIILYILNPETILKVINVFGANTRVAAYFSEAYRQSAARQFGPLIGVLFTAFSIISLCTYVLFNHNYFINIDYVELLLKINIVVLVIFSVIARYTSEVYRIQEGIAVINTMLLTNSISKKSFKLAKMSKRNLAVCSVLVAYSIGIFGIRLLRYLIPSVLMPILNNNIFLSI